MNNLSTFVKRIRDIMRNDAGINGDAQRIDGTRVDLAQRMMLFYEFFDAGCHERTQ